VIRRPLINVIVAHALRQTLQSETPPFAAIQETLLNHGFQSFHEKLTQPPPDAEGFERAELSKLSPAQLWSAWIRPPPPPPVEPTPPPPGPVATRPVATAGQYGAFRDEDDEDDEDDRGTATATAGGAAEEGVSTGASPVQAPASVSSPSETPLPETAGPEAVRGAAEILESPDPWALPFEERMTAMTYVIDLAKGDARAEVEHLAQKFRPAQEHYKNIRVSSWLVASGLPSCLYSRTPSLMVAACLGAVVQERMDLEVLRLATVVGMTTTGAAKYQHLLQQLGVKVGCCVSG
jgi:hypothetical protein